MPWNYAEKRVLTTSLFILPSPPGLLDTTLKIGVAHCPVVSAKFEMGQHSHGYEKFLCKTPIRLPKSKFSLASLLEGFSFIFISPDFDTERPWACGAGIIELTANKEQGTDRDFKAFLHLNQGYISPSIMYLFLHSISPYSSHNNIRLRREVAWTRAHPADCPDRMYHPLS